MQVLSTAFNTELTELRLETYWGSLASFPIEAVQFACAEAVKSEVKFPVPYTLRTYATHYRDAALHRAGIEVEKQLPQWSERPDDVGMQAIHTILRMLGDHMEMAHPVYQQPSMDDPEKRRRELLEQAAQALNHHESKE